MSKSTDQQRAGVDRPDATTTSLLWPLVSDLPTDGNVYLLFHGLFLFAYRQSDGACEVGVHNDAPDHDFRIEAWEVDAGGVATPLPVGNIPNTRIALNVHSPRTPGTHFFQPPEVAGALDPRDWRLVPDLEGTNFYMVKKSGITPPLPAHPTPPIKSFFDLRELDKAAPRSTHEAPCGAVSYGQTGGGHGEG